ncbi:MAG: hypothetical protein ACM30I_00220 [Gemmatimonas sp.]
MKGIVRFRSRQGQHVAIETEDGDYAVARVPGAELDINDQVFGDLINPGSGRLSRAPDGSVCIYLQACRLREAAAREQIESLAVYVDSCN